jgi:hypothetical protein
LFAGGVRKNPESASRKAVFATFICLPLTFPEQDTPLENR